MSLRQVQKLIVTHGDNEEYVVCNQSHELIKHLTYCYICYSDNVKAVICGQCCYNHVCIACGSEIKKCPVCRKDWNIMFMLNVNDCDITIDRVLKSYPVDEGGGPLSDFNSDDDDDEDYAEQVEEKNSNEHSLRFASIETFPTLGDVDQLISSSLELENINNSNVGLTSSTSQSANRWSNVSDEMKDRIENNFIPFASRESISNSSGPWTVYRPNRTGGVSWPFWRRDVPTGLSRSLREQDNHEDDSL